MPASLRNGVQMSDFGEGKWIVCRKSHRCEYCFGPIPRGERCFNYRGMYDGEWQNWRMHEECERDFELTAMENFMPGDAPMPDRIKRLVKV